MMSDQAFVERKSMDEGFPFKGKQPLFTQLDMEITERCNNNCVHCYINLAANDLSAKAKELSTEKIKNILKQATDLGCITVRFTGGEPFLREDFKDIYLFARKLGLKVTLFTNATLVSDELVRLFSDIPPLRELEISLYGMTKASYEKVSRVKGSFEKAFAGIKKLRDAGIPFILKGAFPFSDAQEKKRFEIFAKENTCMTGKPDIVSLYNLTGRRNVKRNLTIQKLRMTPEEYIQHLTPYKEALKKENRQFKKKFMSPETGSTRLFSCSAGKTPCVDAYGKLQVCLLLRHPDTVYDLNHGALKAAIEGFVPKILEKESENEGYRARCARCVLKGFCEQCPARSWMEHGTLDTPVEYYCTLAHEEAVMLGIIPSDKKAWELS